MNATFAKACKKAAKQTHWNDHTGALITLATSFDNEAATALASELQTMAGQQERRGYSLPEEITRRDGEIHKGLLAIIGATLGDDARKLAHKSL